MHGCSKFWVKVIVECSARQSSCKSPLLRLYNHYGKGGWRDDKRWKLNRKAVKCCLLSMTHPRKSDMHGNSACQQGLGKIGSIINHGVGRSLISTCFCWIIGYWWFLGEVNIVFNYVFTNKTSSSSALGWLLLISATLETKQMKI